MEFIQTACGYDEADVKIYDFENSKKTGDIGEQRIIKFLNDLDSTKEVTDVTNIKEFQEKDIDLIITNKDGSIETVEIKTDTYPTNFFYETLSDVERNTAGCLEKSLADFLYYYFINIGKLYIIPMKPFREWFHLNKVANKNIISKKTVPNKTRYGKYMSEGYTIPREFFEQTFPHYYKKYHLPIDEESGNAICEWPVQRPSFCVKYSLF